MAAKCNLLRKLTKNGVFYMFSEYAENLTKSYQQENQYRVIPSKFAMMDLNFEGKNDQYVGEIFQNYYENACSAFRTSGAINLTADGLANELLWKTLYKYGFITTAKQDGSSYINELKYVGDIKLTGLKDVDGINYNEIYCYINNQIPRQKYISAQPKNQTAQVTFSGVQSEGDAMWISGYDATTYPTTNADLNGITISDGHTFIDENNLYRMDDVAGESIIPYVFTDNTDVTLLAIVGDETEFNINSIIVFFDVLDANSKTLYSNIPMGIYFTGNVNDATLTNVITKVVSDEEIYQQGTSYGLRINTKYVCTPQQTSVNILNVDGLSTTDADKYSELLGSIANSQSIMQQLVTEQASFDQDMKDHLALFANYRANVPYVRTISGVRHWFVNGRDMGAFDENEQTNNILSVSGANTVQLKNADASRTFMEYYMNNILSVNSGQMIINTDAESSMYTNGKNIAKFGETGFYINGLNVYDESTNSYKEILSYVKSTIRHDELLRTKFLINGGSSDVTINTTDWTTISSITNTTGSPLVYQYLNSGDVITIVKQVDDKLTPLLLNYQYVVSGETRRFEFINYTTLWIPSSATSTYDILKTQLELETVDSAIVQNYMQNINYIYVPEYNYTTEPFIYISFNALNNAIFNTTSFGDDSGLYGATALDIPSTIQIQYPGTDDRKINFLPIFEAMRGEKGIYMQKTKNTAE